MIYNWTVLRFEIDFFTLKLTKPPYPTEHPTEDCLLSSSNTYALQRLVYAHMHFIFTLIFY